MESNIFEELARTLNHNTGKSISTAMFGTGFALGTLTESGLLVDNVAQEFSEDDYMILDYLKLEDSYNTESTGAHSHEIKTSDKLKSIKVGDRVLVAQMGANCVIVGRISHG